MADSISLSIFAIVGISSSKSFPFSPDCTIPLDSANNIIANRSLALEILSTDFSNWVRMSPDCVISSTSFANFLKNCSAFSFSSAWTLPSPASLIFCWYSEFMVLISFRPSNSRFLVRPPVATKFDTFDILAPASPSLAFCMTPETLTLSPCFFSTLISSLLTLSFISLILSSFFIFLKFVLLACSLSIFVEFNINPYSLSKSSLSP